MLSMVRILIIILLYVFTCLLVAIVFYDNVCDGARGGAKSMMNRRNKQKSRGGGVRAKGHGVEETDAGGCIEKGKCDC